LRFAKCFGFETVKNGQKVDLTLQGETGLVPRGLKIGPEVPKELWVEGLRNRMKFRGEGAQNEGRAFRWSLESPTTYLSVFIFYPKLLTLLVTSPLLTLTFQQTVTPKGPLSEVHNHIYK
jgi:hypothetical protein